MHLGEMPNPFNSQPVITLDDASMLRDFEDVIALYVAPWMTPTQNKTWEARTDIRDSLRPLKFNGRMANIALHSMEDPIEALRTVRERGFKFKSGQRLGSRLVRLRDLDEHEEVLGFSYTADAQSTGRGIIGQVQAELWYYPSRYENFSLGGVIRAVTQPKIETEDFIRLEDESRSMALSALRIALRAAKPTGMHN